MLQRDSEPIKIDVLCVGHASLDIVMHVDHHPSPNEKCHSEKMLITGGGPAANAAITVSRLGGKSAFCGYLGNDFGGEVNINEFALDNVNTSLVVRGDRVTPTSMILVKPDGQRSVVNYNANQKYIEYHEISFANIMPSVILFDGHEPLLSIKLLEFAKENNIPTILDAGSVRKGTTELAPLVDYLVCSEKFAFEYTYKKSPNDALKKLAEISQNVIITLGENGAIWNCRRISDELPAFKVNVVDTTGAGDVFHGAFAYGIAEKCNINDILVKSSASSALCCTKSGARTSIPTLKQLQNFLKNH